MDEMEKTRRVGLTVVLSGMLIPVEKESLSIREVLLMLL